jgi:hypothetical protein
VAISADFGKSSIKLTMLAGVGTDFLGILTENDLFHRPFTVGAFDPCDSLPEDRVATGIRSGSRQSPADTNFSHLVIYPTFRLKFLAPNNRAS